MEQRRIVATGEILTVELGYTPARVEIVNLTSLAKVVWTDLMDEGKTLKTVAAGTTTLETANGISLTDAGSIAVAAVGSRGIVIGAMVDINDTAAEELIVTVFRDDH